MIQHLKLTEKIASQGTRIFPYRQITDYNEVITNSNESVFIHGAVGSRKSSLRLHKDVQDILEITNTKIVMVVDTITMSHKTTADMRNKLNEMGLNEDDVVHYSDKKNVISDRTRIFVVCYDSLMKFEEQFKKQYYPTHLLLDEFKNITKRFTKIKGCKKDENGNKVAYTLADQNQHLQYFISIFNKVKSVKLYDADCDEYLLKFLKDNTKKDFIVYSLVGYKQYNNQIIIKSQKTAKSMMVELLKSGKKLSISCGWKKSALDLSSELHTLVPNMRICVIHSGGAYITTAGTDQNQSQQKIDLIQNPELWNTFNVFIYTPTITTGISFNQEEYFHTHFALVGLGADGTQQAQMIYRIRKLETRTIILVSINDKINTLQSNVSGTSSEVAITNAYTQLNNANVNNNEELINLVHCENTIVNPLDYNQGFEDGMNFTGSLSSSLDFWNKIDTHINKSSSIRLFYDVIRSCYLWGSTEISFQFYTSKGAKVEVIIPHIDNIDSIIQGISYADYRNTNFQEASYINVEFTEELVNDGSQHYKDTIKSILLSSLGYSHKSYEIYKGLTDEYFKLCDNDDATVRDYRKAKQINLYFEYKNVIYYLFHHSINDAKLDYIKTVSKLKSSKEHINYITKILSLYIIFNIFDIIEITRDEIELILAYGTKGKFNFEKGKYLDKIKNFLDSRCVQNTFTAVCSFGQKYNATDKYKQLDSILNFAFKCIGMSVKLNRQVHRSKNDDVVNIISTNNYRLQKSRDFTTDMNENDYDDFNTEILGVEVLNPKIRFAGISEKNVLLDMGKWISDSEDRYIYTGMIYETDTLIGLNRHCIYPEIVETIYYESNSDTDEESDIEFVEVDDYLNICSTFILPNIITAHAVVVPVVESEPVEVFKAMSRNEIESIVRSILYDMIDGVVDRCNSDYIK